MYWFRSNPDESIQKLKRDIIADPGDTELRQRYNALLARSLDHLPTCEFIKYHLEAELAEKQHIAKVAEFKRAWPNYCESCGGWGGSMSFYDPSPGGVGLSPGYMEDFDFCQECVEQEKCPRCKGYCPLVEGDDSDYYECQVCGWTDKDPDNVMEGIPEGDYFGGECTCWEEKLPDYMQRNPDEQESINFEEFPSEQLRELLLCRVVNLPPSQFKKVYVVQYDTFWSLRPLEWIEVITDVLTTDEGYNLSKYKQLKGQPAAVRKDYTDYYSTRNDILVVKPLDWEINEWLDAAEQMGIMKPGEFEHRFF